MRDARQPRYKEVDKQWVYSQVQTRLNGDKVGDALLKSYIDEVESVICNYINRNYVPEPLKYVFMNMLLDLLKSEALNGNLDNDKLADINIGNLSSISDGDTELKFKTTVSSSTGSHIANVDELLYNYNIQLDKYRLLKW